MSNIINVFRKKKEERKPAAISVDSSHWPWSVMALVVLIMLLILLLLARCSLLLFCYLAWLPVM